MFRRIVSLVMLLVAVGSALAGGKVICVFGDSYVRNHKRPYAETWHAKAASQLGLEYVNFGRNGSSVGMDRTAEGFGKSMLQRSKELPDSVSVLLLIAGHNDADMISRNQGYTLQDFSKALDAMLKGLIAKYPDAAIGYVTPWNVDRPNFPEVIAEIKRVCKANGVPVLDATESVIEVNNPEFRKKYFQGDNDTAHLNAAGHDLLVDWGKQFISGLLRNQAGTDAYIKLFDHHGKHPRIVSITYPGDANLLDMYNSIYGHGAVIENPWVAYRVYMDNRQSLDLYVKSTPQVELDVTGFYTTPEQMQQGYGCDVLWAGKSIAAGSFRGYQNGAPVTIDTVAARTQTVIGPTEIEVKDKDWMFNGHPIQMTQRYSVEPDTRDLFVEIELEGYRPADMFATGIQKLESDNRGFILPTGVAGSWGSNVPDKNHPELVEQVGLGIVVDPANIVKTLEDDLNYLVLVRPDKDGKIRYRVIAAGDREAKGFKTADAWLDRMKKARY